MSRKKNKGLDRRGKLMVLMWLGIWLVGGLWSGLHGGNGLLTAVWHGFLTMAACMGLLLLGGCLRSLPEMWRQEVERQERELREKEDRRRELLEEIERKYGNVRMDDDDRVPILPVDDPRIWDRDFNNMFGIKPPSRLV